LASISEKYLAGAVGGPVVAAKVYAIFVYGFSIAIAVAVAINNAIYNVV
jgi:hypothetical protein